MNQKFKNQTRYRPWLNSYQCTDRGLIERYLAANSWLNRVRAAFKSINNCRLKCVQKQGKKHACLYKKTAINRLKFKKIFKNENGSVIRMANASLE
ncbi:hypothetical protein [Leclercia sp. AS011]|uniref:hypothetical protein n=1 Tax=Leclercia sp. AS011 TaxID=3081257 RepID=UPI00301A9A9F